MMSPAMSNPSESKATVPEPATDFTEAQRQEVLRRRNEIIAEPMSAERFDDDYFDRLRQRIAAATVHSKPAR